MSEIRIHDPIDVRIVSDDTGEDIEPALDQATSDLDKLRWHAGALEAHTGIRVQVTTGCSTLGGRIQWHLYGYTMRNASGQFVSSGGSMDFHQMWSWMNGIGAGVRVAKREQP